MVNESDGMVDVTVIASRRTSFEYTFTVTPMERTATSIFDSVLSMKLCIEAVTCNAVYPLSVQTTLTTSIQPLHIRLDLLMTMNLSPHVSYPFLSLMMMTMSVMKTSN